MNADIPKPFVFGSFVRSVTANTAPICANAAAPVNTKTGSNPSVLIFNKPIGTSPQCKPKTTKTCQMAPKMKPAKMGLNVYTAKLPAPIAVPNHVEIGPITRNVTGTTTSAAQNGTKNVLTTSGIIFLKKGSTFEVNQTAKIIGITDDV